MINDVINNTIDKAAQHDNAVKVNVNAGSVRTIKNSPDRQYIKVSNSWTKDHSNIEACVRDTTIDFINQTIIPHLYDIADEDTAEAYRLHDEYMFSLEEFLETENAIRKSQHKKAVGHPSKLPSQTAARIIASTGDVRVIKDNGMNTIIVKKYYKNESTNWQMKWSGIWEEIDVDDKSNIIMKAYRLLSPSHDEKDEKAFFTKLYDAQECRATVDDHLVFCRNGVWSWIDNTFTEYDDPNFDRKFPTAVSLAKLPVHHPLGKAPKGQVAELDANGNIIEPVFSDLGDHTPWHAGSIFTEPFDMNTEVGKASSTICWQMGQSLIRRHNLGQGYYIFKIDWDGKGQNGKGLIADAHKALIMKEWRKGDEDLPEDMSDRVIAETVDNLDGEFSLGQKIRKAYAIMGEESNGSVTYVEKCARMKLLSRRAAIEFNDKFTKKFTFTFDGLLTQDSNDPIIFGEKNDSTISHEICVPFSKSFRDCLKPWIKQFYVHRPIVASYILYMLTVEMPYLDDYDADARKVLEPYKRAQLAAGMNTFQFMNDVLPGLPLTKMNIEMLYDLYIRYCDVNGITGRAVVNSKVFREDMVQYGNNNEHNVYFTRDRNTVDLDELDRPAIALNEYGTSPHHGMSNWRYTRCNGGGVKKDSNPTYYFEKTMFQVPNTTYAKQFNRGFIIRNTPYDDMNYGMEEEMNAVS